MPDATRPTIVMGFLNRYQNRTAVFVTYDNHTGVAFYFHETIHVVDLSQACYMANLYRVNLPLPRHNITSVFKTTQRLATCTLHSLLTDTSIRRTPGDGPCVFYSFYCNQLSIRQTPF